jgi:UDP-GlcNAc:undecaprenyl-phosphate/decaprenyl-phosphate GlcNAc-1-phosphate transferase
MVAATAVLTFLAAALVSFVGGWLVRRTAIRIGAVVPPRPDRWHRTPTPTFGGIAIATGIAAAAALGGGIAPPAAPVLATVTALFAIGWYDDIAPLSALAKMVNSLAVAAFFALTLTTFKSTPTHAVLTIAAVLWFGGVTNAVNLLDNMDGLAAGVTAIAAAAIAWTFAGELGPVVATLPVALSGALVGFLGWNRHPARLFMGNCGSLAIGGLVAAAALIAVARAGTITSAAAAALILIVPLVDTTFVVLLRRLAGRSTTRGNVDHMSHRLVAAGFSEPGAVGLLYGVGALGAGAGYGLHVYGGSAWPLAAGVAVSVLMMALYLARLPAYAGQDFQALHAAPFAPLLSDLTFRWHAGEVLLDLVLIATSYSAAYRLRFEGEALATFLPGFYMSLPAILGCQLAALYVSGLYSRLWNTFGLHDVSTVLRGVATGCVLSVLAVTYLYKFERFSRGVFLIDAVLLTAAILATRSSFRMIGRIAARSSPHATRVAIYGAGMRGQLLVREMLANPHSGRNPVAFVDDNPAIRARRIVGVPVRGSIEELGAMVSRMRIEEVVLSSPDITAATETRVREICAAHAVPVRRLHMDIL